MDQFVSDIHNATMIIIKTIQECCWICTPETTEDHYKVKSIQNTSGKIEKKDDCEEFGIPVDMVMIK